MRTNRMRHNLRGNEKVQRAVLALLLAGDPMTRTLPELSREIGTRGAVEEAVRSLVWHGLVEFQGGVAKSLRPTMAARRCHKLDSW